jgi:hypothetical protein
MQIRSDMQSLVKIATRRLTLFGAVLTAVRQTRDRARTAAMRAAGSQLS